MGVHIHQAQKKNGGSQVDQLLQAVACTHIPRRRAVGMNPNKKMQFPLVPGLPVTNYASQYMWYNQSQGNLVGGMTPLRHIIVGTCCHWLTSLQHGCWLG